MKLKKKIDVGERMAGSRILKSIVGLGASAVGLVLFQNAGTPNPGSWEKCVSLPNCEAVLNGMLLGRGLTSETKGEDAVDAVNEMLEHAANRLGYGPSIVGNRYVSDATEKNWKSELGHLALNVSKNLNYRNAERYTDNEAKLHERISVESTRLVTYAHTLENGKTEEVQFNPYLGLRPQFLMTLKEISYASTQLSANSKAAKERAEELAVKAPGSADHKNAIVLKSVLGAASLGYSNIPADDERRWSILRKIISSQGSNSSGIFDNQINLPEVLAEFWFNHFNIEMDKAGIYAAGLDGYDPTLRRNAYKTFHDMLLGVTLHPGMLRFLDNTTNCIASGEPSNQNLGREILELHTLGQAPGFSDSVYNQSDVVFASRVLAGINVANAYKMEKKVEDGRNVYSVVSTADGYSGTYFNPACADRSIASVRGEQLFRNVKYDQNKLIDRVVAEKSKTSTAVKNLKSAAITDMVAFLAAHPQTKKNICGKLAEQFGTDAVKKSLAGTCIAAWGSRGDLSNIYTQMLSSPDFWRKSNYQRKIKNPVELVVSAARLNGANVNDFNSNPTLAFKYAETALAQIERMGLDYRHYSDPTGYKISGNDWVGSGYLFRNIDASMAMALGYERVDSKIRMMASSDAAENLFTSGMAVGNSWSEKNTAFFTDVLGFSYRFVGPSVYQRTLLLQNAVNPTTVDLRGSKPASVRTAVIMSTSNSWFLQK